MPHIPIATLPSPLPDTSTRIGFVYCHETTAPVVVTNKNGVVTIEVNHESDNLGAFLKDISAILTKAQVEQLVKGKQVKL